MTLVLDASMAIAWLFEEEQTKAADDVMRRVVEKSATVPALWPLEVANALHSAMRRRRCDEAYVNRSLNRLTRLPIDIDSETNLHAWGSTMTLARERYLTIYDASYLELALRLQRPLASCDAALLRAAKACGLEVLPA
ncbi:MAG: type II toxin-antitoxin system VapC family toxin [Beijerinckiaceae bacterium]